MLPFKVDGIGWLIVALPYFALFRGLDRVDVSAQEMPQKELKKLRALDADCAEALWALANPRGLKLRKMMKDTERSIRRIRKELLAKLPERILAPLANHNAQILTTLTLQDTYRNIG